MSAYRCQDCEVDWPARKDFKKCPGCLTPTKPAGLATPISEADAKSLASRYRFERFYRVWDAGREKRGELSPEVLGRLEAQEMFPAIKEAKELDRAWNESPDA